MGANGEAKNKRGRERETEAMRMTLSNRDVLQKGHFLRTTAFENLKSMCNFNILGQKISHCNLQKPTEELQLEHLTNS